MFVRLKMALRREVYITGREEVPPTAEARRDELRSSEGVLLFEGKKKKKQKGLRPPVIEKEGGKGC